jgi:hypothetical protein
VTSSLASHRSFFDAVEQRVQNAEANFHGSMGTPAAIRRRPERESIDQSNAEATIKRVLQAAA